MTNYYTVLSGIAGNNLQAHWTCNVSGTSTTVFDSTSHNCDLTLVGSGGRDYRRGQPSLLPNDPTGKSLWFDGTTTAPYNYGYAWGNYSRLNAAYNNLTLNAWCQIDRGNNTYNSNANSPALLGILLQYELNCVDSVVGKAFNNIMYDSGGSGSTPYTTSTNTNSLFAGNGGRYYVTNNNSTNTMTTENSYMVTSVITSGSPYTCDLYINGVHQSSKTLGSYAPFNGLYAFGLANIGNGAVTGSYFNGWLQHVSAISTSLSQTDIQTIYSAGVNTAQTNSSIVFSWPSTVVSENSSRKSITICNNSDLTVYLTLSGTTANPILLRGYGGRWTNTTYTGSVSAVVEEIYSYTYVTVMEE